MWDPQTLAGLNQKFEDKAKQERAESEKLGEKEFEEAAKADVAPRRF